MERTDGIDLRAVIVDWGGVMTLPPTPEAFARLQELVGLDADAFPIAWLRHRHAYDLGEVDAAEYWRRVGAEGDRAVDADTLAKLRVADAACWAVPNPAMVAWLATLKRAGMKLALLSNTPREQWQALRETLTWLPLCDAVVLSYELRIAKPDPKIYAHCLDDLGSRGEETLFIDDRQENVEAARQAGIHAVVYTTTEALRAELEERYGALLPLP
jgi:putative hydrolase of the HAD superfamily